MELSIMNEVEKQCHSSCFKSTRKFQSMIIRYSFALFYNSMLVFFGDTTLFSR